MKKELLVKTKIKNYKIIIEKDCSKKFLQSNYFNASKTFVIIDTKISKTFYKFFKKNNNLKVIKINGSEKINGVAADLTVSVERAAFTLVFTDSTQGWVLKDK